MLVLFLDLYTPTLPLCTLISTEIKPGEAQELWSTPVLYMLLVIRGGEPHSVTQHITIEITSVYSGTKYVLLVFRASVSFNCCLAHAPGYVFHMQLGI